MPGIPRAGDCETLAAALWPKFGPGVKRVHRKYGGLAWIAVLCKCANVVRQFSLTNRVDKGKPVEKQGRKVSDLRGKTYDSGAAKILSRFSMVALPDRSYGAIMSMEILVSGIPPPRANDVGHVSWHTLGHSFASSATAPPTDKVSETPRCLITGG